MPPEIRFEVVEHDALTLDTDVLVLKYAQALHGLDARVVDVADLDASRLPLPDGFRSAPWPARSRRRRISA